MFYTERAVQDKQTNKASKMQTIFDLVEAVKQARNVNGDAFGVHYFSASNPANRHYVVLRSEAELENLKAFYREYDFKFYVVTQ